MVTVSNSSSGENRFSNDHFPSYPVVIVSIEIIPIVFCIDVIVSVTSGVATPFNVIISPRLTLDGISENTNSKVLDIVLFSDCANLILISCSAPTESIIRNFVLSESIFSETLCVIMKFPLLSVEKDFSILSLI